MSNFCRECGTALNGAKFCPNCGVSDNDNPVHDAKESQSVQIGATAPKKKWGVAKVVIRALGIPFGLMLVIYLIAFYNQSDSPATDQASSQTSAAVPKTSKAQVNELEIISDGDTIKTDSCEVTINSVVFSYDVLPETRGALYTHYEADKGQVYIDIDVDVKNLAKQNLRCNDIMKVTANYNDGYTYRAMPVVEDSIGFTYANITSIDPLETRAMRYLVDCPQEVEETSAPLFLTLKIDGESFKYIIRGG